ncbi:MAG: adenylyl-sulfate kinase [Alicyclobacillus sp. RIFOXYA1_FULL_53_8]|nr:MAG: adenylyl-sulfate kinase [Alicyclobacillus sp. RIFOXYA1_FULL_53_8]
MSQSKNITWNSSKLTKSQRQERNNHKSLVVWLTGLSGSGKSTIANELEQQLFNMGQHVYVLDGDNIRFGINSDLGFSDADRKENIRRVAEVAKLFVDAGVIVIVAIISPFESGRQLARGKFEPGEFVEVFVDCPLDTCLERDPKGLYRKAVSGQINQFTGITSAYENPTRPEVIVQTAQLSVQECAAKVMACLNAKEMLTCER